MSNLGLVAPWTNLYRQVEALFGQDPDVRVEIDEESYIVKLYVENEDKAVALSKILPTKKDFGGVIVTITVIPANGVNFYNAELFNTAFNNNPAFKFAETITPEGTNNPMTFVVFSKKVVQYYIDNPFALKGLCSTLYEDIAADVLDTDGVFYSTNDTED